MALCRIVAETTALQPWIWMILVIVFWPPTYLCAYRVICGRCRELNTRLLEIRSEKSCSPWSKKHLVPFHDTYHESPGKRIMDSTWEFEKGTLEREECSHQSSLRETQFVVYIFFILFVFFSYFFRCFFYNLSSWQPSSVNIIILCARIFPFIFHSRYSVSSACWSHSVTLNILWQHQYNCSYWQLASHMDRCDNTTNANHHKSIYS